MNDLTTQSQETDAENNESIEHRGLEIAARSRAGFVRNPDRLGGAEGDRTPDLMTASHALSQLSYGPVCEASPKTLKISLALKRSSSNGPDNVAANLPL